MLGATSSEQNARFGDKSKLHMRRTAFPPHFAHKLDVRKVQLAVIEPWVTGKVAELMGIEDEILVQFVMSQLTAGGAVDPKAMQVNLTGFLEAHAAPFMSELWQLLLSAQAAPGGIPPEFVERKKEELRLKKLEQERLEAELRERRQAAEQASIATRLAAEASAREMAERRAKLEEKLALRAAAAAGASAGTGLSLIHI